MNATFDSTNPATGELVGTFAQHDAEAVAVALQRAREASRWWAQLGFAGRKQRLLEWRRVIARRFDELTELMHREGGKPLEDAAIEVSLTLEHLDWAATKAQKTLGRRAVSPGLLLANHQASVQYLPYGVIGVIGPWNYPVLTPMGSIAYALAAGNAVIFKPSELTTAVGKWLVDRFSEVVGDSPVLQVVTGLGATGQALCESGVDKIAFTGSTRTAKQVMSTCAETLTPVLIECGGKDVLIVDDDADIEQAAQAAAWGACSNAGQTCIGIERVYAHARVYDELLERIAQIMSALQPGTGPGAAYGPMTMPEQLEIIAAHIDDALARGGRAVVGGRESVAAPYVHPVLLTGVPEDSTAMTQETFGPVLVVNPVASRDEAIEKANATRFGLGAAVFADEYAEQIAQRLRVGMVSINSVVSYAGVPALPFGGVGDSGFGRIHGEDGLREFARPQSVARLRIPIPLVVSSFARKPYAVRLLTQVVRRRSDR